MIANLQIGAISQRGTVGFRTPTYLGAAASLVSQVFFTVMIVLYPTSVKRLTGGLLPTMWVRSIDTGRGQEPPTDRWTASTYRARRRDTGTIDA